MIEVKRKGRIRVIRNVQSCWFSGVLLDVAKDKPDSWSREHIVPVSSNLIAAVKHNTKNFVPTCYVINGMVGSLPLAIKYRVMQRLRISIHGTTDFRENFTPVPWSNEIKNLASKIVGEETDRFRLLNRLVYRNPVIDPDTGIRLWSLENPHVEITQDILNERKRLLNVLYTETVEAFNLRFGFVDSDVHEAIAKDLNMDT